MHNIIRVLRGIKCIHFFLNHRPFLKFPERQKALHSLLLPDSFKADAISTASSIRCRTRGWFAFDPASFCEKNSDLIVRAVFRSRPLIVVKEYSTRRQRGQNFSENGQW